MPSPATREPLHRSHGSDPSSFYEAIAITYNEALTRTSASTTVLAAEADVPVPTVPLDQRGAWRGLRPPGRKGRAE